MDKGRTYQTYDLADYFFRYTTISAKVLYERYFADQTGGSDHPALVILKQLTTSSEELKLTVSTI